LGLARARRWACEFDRATERPQEVQNQLLRRIVQQNKHTGFGRAHRFSEIRTLTDFRRNVPISRYEDFEPYMALVRQGRLDALLSERTVHMFALTSGTTASRKYIPVTPQYLSDYRRGWAIWGLAAVERHPRVVMRAILQIAGDWDEFRTEGNIPCGSISGLTMRMQNPLVRSFYCLPPIASKIPDFQSKCYLALRLGLGQRVGLIVSANPSTHVQLARLADQEKEALIRDLHDGSLDHRFVLPVEVRASVDRRIRRPRPKRARELEAIVQRSGALYLKDCWPGLELIGTWTGGSVGFYLQQLSRYYGSVAVRDLGLVASEGRFSIPLEDRVSTGVLDVTSHFFEFVPEAEMDSPAPIVLRSDELEEGNNYFILPTTTYGLYRYNIFDVVRVTGFHNRTPLIEFLNKGSYVSSLTGEKLSEYQVVRAFQSVQEQFNLGLTAYSAAPCCDRELPYYGLFLEQENLSSVAQTRALAEAMDGFLRLCNIEYDAKRASKRLGCLQVFLLPLGTWRAWDRERMKSRGCPPEQYKHPCLIPDLAFHQELAVQEVLDPVRDD
jgi:hypothetical protein